MTIIPDVVTMSDVKHRSAEIIARIQTAPVIITQRGETAGIFASVALWNQREAELARLQRIIIGDAASARIATGDYVEFPDASPY